MTKKQTAFCLSNNYHLYYFDKALEINISNKKFDVFFYDD